MLPLEPEIVCENVTPCPGEVKSFVLAAVSSLPDARCPWGEALRNITNL
jgi:hypothetical protein